MGCKITQLFYEYVYIDVHHDVVWKLGLMFEEVDVILIDHCLDSITFIGRCKINRDQQFHVSNQGL